MLDLLKKNKCSKVLNDNRNVKGSWSEASDWAGKEWLPEMEAAGLRFLAWVYSPSRFSQLAAEKSVNVSRANVVIKFFDDIEEASNWLEEQ